MGDDVDAEEVPLDLVDREAHAVDRDRALTGDVARELRGDLDNIILKAMDKDPARRYSHAEAFGEDICRYLEGRPVSARASSFGYRTLKFARRNKTLVFSAVSVGLLLAVAFAVALREAHVARLEGEAAERRFALIQAFAEEHFDAKAVANAPFAESKLPPPEVDAQLLGQLLASSK